MKEIRRVRGKAKYKTKIPVLYMVPNPVLVSILYPSKTKPGKKKVAVGNKAASASSVGDPWHFGADPDPRIHTGS